MMPDKFFAVNQSGKRYEFKQQRMGNSLFLTLKKETIFTDKQVRVLTELGAAKAGDEGYWIIPRNHSRLGDMQTFFREREDTTEILERPAMSWYGIKCRDFTCMVRIDRNYRYCIEASVKDNAYSICAVFDFTEDDEVYDDIRLEIIFLDKNAEYADMARTEREIRLARDEIYTLADKCKKEAVEYARKYPIVRIRMGWKPSPSPVLHQNETNEPDMFVACDFARVRDIADEMKRQGVEGAELQLVGWNRSGHDGRFPQHFPADSRLGGDAEFKKTIDYVKSLGYRISTHTNTIDAVEVADCFDWNDVAINRDGHYTQIGHYSAGLAYHVCPIQQYKNAKRDLPKLASFGENGLHFTDVVSIVMPDYCASPNHKSNTANGIIYYQKQMEYTRGLFGGFSSEGCMDFAMKHMDFALYATFGNSFGEKTIPICDRYLPIFELVYHGIVMYNPMSATVNYTVQSPEHHLLFIMRGGKPAMYFYSKFRTGSAKNWMGDKDLTCENDESLSRSVGYIKMAADEYKLFADRQLIYMTNYEILDNGIHIATYEDGCAIVGNFTDKATEYNGKAIEPWGYVIV